MNVILTTYQGAFLGPIARVLGRILEAIYSVLELVGIQNTGICIILFTFIVNALMLPLQIKQQKFSRMSSIMNPELVAIQNKYKNKKDQASQQKMSLETQAVYQKYGVSPASGCLPLLITFPILFALYRVIYNVPAYVGQVYDIYVGLAEKMQDMGVTVEQLSKFMESPTVIMTDAVNHAKEIKDVAKVNLNYYIDILGQYNKEAWEALGDKYPSMANEIGRGSKDASHINYFLGMNISDNPSVSNFSVMIPVLSVITQIVSTKLSMAGMAQNQQNSAENPTAASMKMMNNIMPFVSGLMCFMFQIGVGLYWIAGNVFRIFQSIGINFYFSRMDMNEEINKNVEKKKKRLEKMGIDPNASVQDLKNQKTAGKKQEKKTNVSEITKNVKKNDYKRPQNTKYKEGSIASYANMLNRDNSSGDKK